MGSATRRADWIAASSNCFTFNCPGGLVAWFSTTRVGFSHWFTSVNGWLWKTLPVPGGSELPLILVGKKVAGFNP